MIFDFFKKHYHSVSHARVCKENHKGRNRYFAFVFFGNTSEFQNALTQMNEANLNGRILKLGIGKKKTNQTERIESSQYQQMAKSFGIDPNSNINY